MDARHVPEKNILCHLFYGYLKCLEKTVRIEWIQPEEFHGRGVIGFWHEDSFAMNLVLKNMTDRGGKVSVLVTGDDRGDYIQYMVEKCRGKAVHVGYGFCNMGMMRELLDSLEEPDRTVAIAMDGPLGPRHIPKKITYFLPEQSGAELVGVTLSYSGKISIKHRWDHYRIPLPFSKIRIQFDNYGAVSCKNKPQMRVCQEARECSIISVGA